MAERRCVGVYSSSADIKSMASGDALRKTLEPSVNDYDDARSNYD